MYLVIENQETDQTRIVHFLGVFETFEKAQKVLMDIIEKNYPNTKNMFKEKKDNYSGYEYVEYTTNAVPANHSFVIQNIPTNKIVDIPI